MPLEIEELPGSLGSLDYEIHVPRERSAPGPAGAFPLSREFNPISSGQAERLLSKLREVQAPVNLSTAIREGVVAARIQRSCRKLRNCLSLLGSSLLRMHPASIDATIHLITNARQGGALWGLRPLSGGVESQR